jgi:uncharacterized protein (TIGR03083 family)
MTSARDVPRSHDLDYLAHLARESARFGTVMETTAPQARVPSCPDWDADDLFWHLGEVQWFWGTIVRDRVDVDAAEQMKPPRPTTRPGLAEFFASASRDLSSTLAVTPPQTVVWTWADDKTAGFVRRRQAHEALIHRVDAELTAGSRTGLDPSLAADGVDEALRIMYGGTVPDWGNFAAGPGQTLRIRATDTSDSWLVALGQFSGTDPDHQRSYDQAGIHVATADPGDQTAAVVAGTAGDLDCWLWGRPTLGVIERSGDPAVLGRFDATIAEGVD